MYLWGNIQIHLCEIYIGRELLGPMIFIHSAFEDILKLISKTVIPIYTLINNERKFQLYHILANNDFILSTLMNAYSMLLLFQSKIRLWLIMFSIFTHIDHVNIFLIEIMTSQFCSFFIELSTFYLLIYKAFL